MVRTEVVDVLYSGVCSQCEVRAEADENLAVPKRRMIYSKSHNTRNTILRRSRDIDEDRLLECFDVLLTVHLSIFISVFNQHDAQNLFHNKFYFMPLHVSNTCAHHHQEVKITLHSLWYHHTYRCDDTR